MGRSGLNYKILVVLLILLGFAILGGVYGYFSSNYGMLGIVVFLTTTGAIILSIAINLFFRSFSKNVNIGHWIMLGGYFLILISPVGGLFSALPAMLGLLLITVGLFINLITLVNNARRPVGQYKPTSKPLIVYLVLIIIPLIFIIIVSFNTCFYGSNDLCVAEKAIEKDDQNLCNNILDSNVLGGGYNSRNYCLCSFATDLDRRDLCAYCFKRGSSTDYNKIYSDYYKITWENCYLTTSRNSNIDQEMLDIYYKQLTDPELFSPKFLLVEYQENSDFRNSGFLECYEENNGVYEDVRNCAMNRENTIRPSDIDWWPDEFDLGKNI